MILLSVLFIFKFSSAAPLEEHRQQMQTYAKQIMEHEVRLAELKKKKEKSQEGEYQEEILSEIADLHKELLSIKKNRESVRIHIRKEHPKEDSFADLSFYKQTDPKNPANKKADVQVDKKLDELLSLVQSQYARTLSEDFKISKDIQTEEDVRRRLKEQRVKVIRSNKKKYIRDEIETTIKAE
ncbi:hypothetical protein K2X05_01470 [bacterium]|nr:hypothetical protein [bacterium]